MSPFTQELDRLEEAARPYARTLEVRARRFFTAFIPAFIIAISVASSHLTLGLVLSTGLSLAITILGELDPSVPWSTFARLLDRQRYEPTPPSTKGSGA